jgi:hypothetical protein
MTIDIQFCKIRRVLEIVCSKIWMYLTLCSELTLENDSDGKFYVYFMTVKNKKTISTFFPRDYI